MKKISSFMKVELTTMFLSMILGSLLHFSYSWSNNNPIVGVFSAINESTWEHLKILFWPNLLTIIIGYIHSKNKVENYICYKIKGLLLSLVFIVVFFYTYNGVIGGNIILLDISSFYVAILLGEYFTLKQIKKNSPCNKILFLFILILLSISFVAYTFLTPNLGIFKDPVTNTYGIYKKKYK